MDSIQQIKLSAFQIADSLEVDTDDFEELSQEDEFAVIDIQMEQEQTQEQEQLQRVTVDALNDDVDGMMIASEDEEVLRELIDDYAEEIKENNPDRARLRALLDRAGDYSTDIRRKLIMMATERGVDLLLGLW